jgi:hypothetical protein
MKRLPRLRRIARFRILGRRGVREEPLGFYVNVYGGQQFWSVAVFRSGGVHASIAPSGWRIEYGCRLDTTRKRAAREIWIVLDVPARAHVDVRRMSPRRRTR